MLHSQILHNLNAKHSSGLACLEDDAFYAPSNFYTTQTVLGFMD